MIPTDTRLSLTECPRCGAPVLTGRSEGLGWRVDRWTVPHRHALVLTRYGVPVLVVDRRASGRLDAAVWTPDHDLTTPHRYLACPHVCGSAAARGLEMA